MTKLRKGMFMRYVGEKTHPEFTKNEIYKILRMEVSTIGFQVVMGQHTYFTNWVQENFIYAKEYHFLTLFNQLKD